MTELGDLVKHPRLKKSDKIPVEDLLPRLLGGTLTIAQFKSTLCIPYNERLPSCLISQLRYEVTDSGISRHHTLTLGKAGWPESAPPAGLLHVLTSWIGRHAAHVEFVAWHSSVQEYLRAREVIHQLQYEERVRHGG